MELAGSYRIPAPREKIWAALNDPEILGSCIPGCESIEKVSDTDFTATVRAKVGPVNARFSGKVRLVDLQPPESYRIVGEGSGGVAGFAKGDAKVTLVAETTTATTLSYVVDAQVGGKLVQIGSRLIESTARKMADDFFGKFCEQVGGEPAEAVPVESEPPTEAASAAWPAWLPWAAAVAALAVALAALA